MNKDKPTIEDVIKSNKERFDYHIPPPMVWDEIEKKLPEKTKTFRLLSLWPLMGVAASFLIIGILGAQYFITANKQDPQIEKIDQYYKNQFNVGYEMLQQKDNIPDELGYELQELEKIELELKEEILKNYGDTREVMVKRLIDHYKTKIKLIELINNKKDNINYEHTEI